MQLLFDKLETPMMRNLNLRWPEVMGEVEVYPRRLPDIYAGEPLIITAKSKSLNGNVEITGQRGQQPWHASFQLSQRAKLSGTAVLWARNRIATLMDSLHDGVNKNEVRQAVIKTALEHHLVSKYTSLVAVDITPSRLDDKSLQKSAIPTNLPKGMIRSKVFGASMTQTATASQMHMLIGLFLLLLAGALYVFSGRCSSCRQPRRIPM
jgi:Ca-activated chloride channel family protein